MLNNINSADNLTTAGASVRFLIYAYLMFAAASLSLWLLSGINTLGTCSSMNIGMNKPLLSKFIHE